MHGIKERPVTVRPPSPCPRHRSQHSCVCQRSAPLRPQVNGEIVSRPMMYVALTYDHRIVDGREAVGFLKHIKECVEDPRRLLLGL